MEKEEIRNIIARLEKNKNKKGIPIENLHNVIEWLKEELLKNKK